MLNIVFVLSLRVSVCVCQVPYNEHEEKIEIQVIFLQLDFAKIVSSDLRLTFVVINLLYILYTTPFSVQDI